MRFSIFALFGRSQQLIAYLPHRPSLHFFRTATPPPTAFITPSRVTSSPRTMRLLAYIFYSAAQLQRSDFVFNTYASCVSRWSPRLLLFHAYIIYLYNRYISAPLPSR